MASKDGVQTLALRYARALFDLAQEQKNLDGICKEVQQIKSIIRDSRDFVSFIETPLLSRTEKEKGIEAILTAAKIEGLSRTFCQMLARNRRLMILPDIINTFEKLASEAQGLVVVEITSAAPLEAQQVSDISASLKEALGRDADVQTQVQAALLGGLRMRMGSTILDGSVATKLERFSQEAIQAIAS